MSKENVEFVRNLFTAGASMDKQALLAALPELIPQVADPDIEWIEDPTRVDSRTYRGHDGVLRSWKQWLDEWDEYGFEIERLLDCGEEVLVVAKESGSGAASGATVSSHIYLLVTVREQKIRRWREFYDESAARKAAGLTE